MKGGVEPVHPNELVVRSTLHDAALVEDQRRLVIERSNEAEEAFAAALRETVRHDLPPAARRDLERILSSQARFT